jgi:hypothetical protein
MPSRLSNGLIALGALGSFVGICFLPAALGEHADSNLLGLGAAIFGMGALLVAAGFYLKAQVLQLNARGAAPVKESASPEKRLRGSCDLCHKEMPVVHCKVHQFHLCGNCLAEHYDFRACVYVPSTRRVEAKGGKSMAARAR